MTMRIAMHGCRLVAAALIAAAAVAGSPVSSQPGQSKGPPSAMQGFSTTNKDKPVRIQAASLEVRDKDKIATFKGDVHVVQGDMDLRCKVLVVFYEGDATKPNTPAGQPGPEGQQQIRRMEATGGVVVTQKDQVATGDKGEFDVRSNIVILTGNVVVTRGQDVLRGTRLVADLTSGVSNVESGKKQGERVDVLMTPRQRPDANAGQSQTQTPTPSPTQPARPPGRKN
jgi:lipopolysaccharide export system protein LptA